jgi:hypothetical protein
MNPGASALKLPAARRWESSILKVGLFILIARIPRSLLQGTSIDQKYHGCAYCWTESPVFSLKQLDKI